MDANGDIDDDGEAESVSVDHYFRLVKGKDDVASGANFYIYDNTGTDDVLDAITVKGKTSPDHTVNVLLAGLQDPPAQVEPTNEEADLGDITDDITWASETISVTPTVDEDATFVVTTNIGTDDCANDESLG